MPRHRSLRTPRSWKRWASDVLTSVRISGCVYPDAVHRPLAAPLINGGSWTVQSDTHSDVKYTVTRSPDGRWECNCPGGRYGARADGLCKHIDRVQGWLAQPPLATVPEAVLSWPGGATAGSVP